MKILIISRDIDMHADAVRWGLTEKGHDVEIWDWTFFPRKDVAAFSICSDDDTNYLLQIADQEKEFLFDVIWVRRPQIPKANPDCHKDDIDIIVKESTTFLSGIFPYVGHKDTLWINDIASGELAENKIRQLIKAKEVGFRIPKTVIGNSPVSVKRLYLESAGRIIFKMLGSAAWKNEDGTTTVRRTTQLSKAHVENEFAIKACPGIYQELIDKKYELRVTVVGDQVIAAKIDSQKNNKSVDWRFDNSLDKSVVSLYELPSEIADKCIALCRNLGLVFGAFDLAVTNSEEFIFIELNQMGQFLWIETLDDKISLLDEFCSFIARGGKHVRLASEKRATFAGYLSSSNYARFQEATTLPISEREHGRA